MKELKTVFDAIRSIRLAAGMKVNRNFQDYFADRIIKASSEDTLLKFMEQLSKSVDISLEYINKNYMADAIKLSSHSIANAILAWIRENPRITAMIVFISEDSQYQDVINSIVIDESIKSDDSACQAQGKFDIPMTVELLSPLAHGADMKAGNATLLRRCQIITNTGAIKELPFYAGNALRGQMRDLLADDYLVNLGLPINKNKPIVNLWFFHALYAGGVLEPQSKAMESINAEMGKSGAYRTDGIRRFREFVPMLSLLGVALGNRIVPGRINVNDLRPRCMEWGTGETPVRRLIEWTYLTRREDYEGRTDKDAHTGMIANTECLRTGVVMDGGIDMDTHITNIEKSVLARGLELLSRRGFLGAENRRGLGKVKYDIRDSGDDKLYLDWMKSKKTDILQYLSSVGALAEKEETENAHS